MTINFVKNQIINSTHSISDKKDTTFKIHCHEEYEILYIAKGNLHYMIEQEDYYPSKNSVLLIPPGVIHGIERNNQDGYERYVAHINHKQLDTTSLELLKRIFKSNKHFVLSDDSEIRQVFEDLYTATDIDEKLFYTAFDALLLKVLLLQNKIPESNSGFTSNKTVADIIAFLNEHYTEDLTLDDIANKFFISKHHLNEIFKKSTGITVWEYVIRKRIFKARTLIKDGLRASEAADKSGFSDYSVFYKAYTKRFSKNPKQDK